MDKSYKYLEYIKLSFTSYSFKNKPYGNNK